VRAEHENEQIFVFFLFCAKNTFGIAQIGFSGTHPGMLTDFGVEKKTQHNNGPNHHRRHPPGCCSCHGNSGWCQQAAVWG
jgi:hypothetical protein